MSHCPWKTLKSTRWTWPRWKYLQHLPWPERVLDDSSFMCTRISVEVEGYIHRRPHWEVIPVTYCCITNHSKTLWLKVTTIVYFSHESTIRAGVGRVAHLFSGSISWNGLGWAGLGLEDPFLKQLMHIAGKLQLAVSWELSQSWRLGVFLRSVEAELKEWVFQEALSGGARLLMTLPWKSLNIVLVI